METVRMSMRYPVMVGACALIVSPLVVADSGWTAYAPVAELVPTARHYYEVRIPVKDNPSGCKNKSGFYQDYGSSGADHMFQALLEALTSGKRVRVNVTGRCNLDGYSEVSAVGVIP